MRTPRVRPVPILALFALLSLAFPASARAQQIPSPEEFFGHEMGADRQLARWDRLVEYYDLIGEASDRIDVRHVGESTLGNPFVIIFVTSPENHASLAEIKAMNATLQDPRGASQAEIDRAVTTIQPRGQIAMDQLLNVRIREAILRVVISCPSTSTVHGDVIVASPSMQSTPRRV